MEGYDFETRPLAHTDAVIKGDKWRLSILADGLVRCEWAEDGQFEDRASTFAINRDLPVPKFRVLDKKEVVEVVSDRFYLTYDRKEFSPDGLTINVLGKVTDHKSRWRYPEFSDSLGGTARTLDGVDGRCELGPGVISTHGYSALNDSDSMLFEGKNWVGARRPGRREDIYVFTYGMDFKEAMKTFYAVSGKQPEIPRWSLGNWWSRYHAYSDHEYLDLMSQFDQRKIPLSVAVLDMDWHLVDDPRVSHSGWTGYTWNEKLFPDPAAFLKKLRDQNLKITANDHPAEGVHSFEDPYPAMAKEMNFDTSNKDPLLFDCTSPTYMKAYLNMWRSLDFDFCWIDWQQGTSSLLGFDPLWVLNHYHHLDNAKVNSIPLVFSRYAGPGSHRYPVGFSGDSYISWASLHFQPEFTATASNIGFAQWSHDIGGHMFGERNDEMATRWVQLGVFSPLMRLHSTQNKWMSKEPWIYRKEAEEAMTEMMRLRHRLIPYLYTMNLRAARDGEPLVQPVYWHHPERREAYLYKNTFFFGSDLFVAPITSPRSERTGLASVKAWLPPSKGRWVDIFTGQVYEGDRTITLWRRLDQIPVFAQEGTVIPLDANLTPSNGAKNPEAMEVLIVPGADAKHEIIEDVADDASHKAGGQVGGARSERKTALSWTQSKSLLEIKADGALDRKWSWRVVGVEVGANTSGHVESSDGPLEATVKGAEAGLMPRDAKLKERLTQLLNAYQTPFSVKDGIYDAVISDKPLATRTTELLQLPGTDEELLGPVWELLLADSRPASE